MIDVNDVIHHAGYALGQLGRRAHPGDPLILGQDGRVAEDLNPVQRRPMLVIKRTVNGKPLHIGNRGWWFRTSCAVTCRESYGRRRCRNVLLEADRARLRYKAARAHAPAYISIQSPYCTSRTSYKAFGKTQPFLGGPRGSVHQEQPESPRQGARHRLLHLPSASLVDPGQCTCCLHALAGAHADGV